MLATVSELVDRGERIIYYCTEEFRSKIEQTGAEFRPYQGLINSVKIENYDLFRLLKLQIDMAIDKLDYNLETVRDQNPDYIVHDSLCIWGKYMASIIELPAVNLMHSFPIASSSDFVTTDNADTLVQILLYKIINRFKKNSPKKILKKKYGIKLSIGDTFINREGLNVIYTSKHMAPQIHQTEKDYCFVGPSLFFKKDQSNFPYERLQGQKVIYISLGTMHNDNPDFYKMCLRAFKGKDYHVVISVGKTLDSHVNDDFPENFTVRQSVPQQKLLEVVDLFITHAGMNSVNEAICRGVPMLLLPQQSEQMMIARRVMEMGIGNIMKLKAMNAKSLFEWAGHLISDPKYKKAAEKYKSIFRAEEKVSHIKAADAILNYTRKAP